MRNKPYIYEYKGHLICLRSRSNGYYAWIDYKPFTKGLHKSNKAGDNLFEAKRAVENAIDFPNPYQVQDETEGLRAFEKALDSLNE